MATQLGVIKAFMRSLDTEIASGVTALNNAVRACSSFDSIKSVIDNLIRDCYRAESPEDFLRDYCGIVLTNTDTGAITGSDAGNLFPKTAKSIVPETGESSYPEETTFTKRGLTVVVPEKSTLTTDQQTIVQGLYSWWIDESLNLIEQSYGYSFTDSDATCTKITVKFIDEPDSFTLAYVTPGITYAGVARRLTWAGTATFLRTIKTVRAIMAATFWTEPLPTS